MNKEEQIEFIKDNYPATTHHISKRRVRHNFFSSIKTELQAYLLGFYTADGSIDEKRKTLRVELQKGDSEIVYLFKDNISEDARLYQTKERDFIGPKGKIIHAHGNIGVDITSAQLCQDLVNLGIGYRKSYEDLKLPKAKPNDLVAMTTTGAYGYSMASNYNRNQKPAVVFVENGKTQLVVKRETIEDVARFDLDLK